MTTFDDPNRESVGLPPIWTGAGEEPPTEPPTEETDLPADDDEPENDEPYGDEADAPS